MESNLTKVNSCIRELEVNAKSEEVKPIYDETLDKYIKNAAIPGFRKGKAPVSMLIKMYADSIDADFKEEVINKLSKNYFEESKVYPVSRIKLLSLDYKEGEEMKFKIQFEVYPEFELNKYKGLEIEKPIINATDDEVEHEIEHILESERKLEPAEKVTDEKYLVTADVQELDPSGIPIIGKMEKDAKVSLNDENIVEDVRKALLNVSEGDEVKVKIPADKSPSQNEINLSFVIMKIEKIVYPDLDETLIKKVTRNMETTVDGLKKSLHNRIQDYYNETSENEFRNNMLRALVDNNDFDIPEIMIENYLEDLIENIKKQQPNKTLPSTFDVLDYKQKNRANAVLSLKSFVLRSKIIETEKIEVDDVDLSDYADKEAVRLGMAKEKILNYLKTSEQIKDSILLRKFDAFMKDNNKIIEKDLRKEPEQKEESKIITA